MSRVRLTAGEIGQHSKVEVLAGEEWLDISRVVTGFDIHVRCGDLSTASIDVVRIELTDGSHPVILDEKSLGKLALLVDDARAAGRIPEAA